MAREAWPNDRCECMKFENPMVEKKRDFFYLVVALQKFLQTDKVDQDEVN